MLSPMGLSLVSKVSPIRWRGIMMGGWFVATGFGNKLTQIGQLWDDWRNGDHPADSLAAFEEGHARGVKLQSFEQFTRGSLARSRAGQP
jgi:hypothetical protein